MQDSIYIWMYLIFTFWTEGICTHVIVWKNKCNVYSLFLLMWYDSVYNNTYMYVHTLMFFAAYLHVYIYALQSTYISILTALYVLSHYIWLLIARIWHHLLNQVSSQQTTIIITTHYIEEARQAHLVRRRARVVAIRSPVPRPSHVPSSFWSLAVCKNGGGRPGTIYHVNDVSVYLGRQRGGGVPRRKNKLEAWSCSFCPKRWSFDRSRSERRAALGSKQRTRAQNASFRTVTPPPICLPR